jgi:hypothetical protein
MTFPLLTLIGIGALVVLGLEMRYFPRRGSAAGLGLAPAPWPLQVLLPLAGLALFLWLARLGPRVKRCNDEHLRLP